MKDAASGILESFAKSLENGKMLRTSFFIVPQFFCSLVDRRGPLCYLTDRNCVNSNNIAWEERSSEQRG